MESKKRQMSERSLKNLELGSKSRDLGKQRHNFTILPDSMAWLRGTGNASDAIDSLVELARNGGLNSKDTHDQKQAEYQKSIDTYEREIQDLKRDLEETQLELSKTRSLLEHSKQLEKSTSDTLAEFTISGFEAARILKEVLQTKIRSAAWESIKQKIQEAITLVDDV